MIALEELFFVGQDAQMRRHTRTVADVLPLPGRWLAMPHAWSVSHSPLEVEVVPWPVLCEQAGLDPVAALADPEAAEARVSEVLGLPVGANEGAFERDLVAQVLKPVDPDGELVLHYGEKVWFYGDDPLTLRGRISTLEDLLREGSAYDTTIAMGPDGLLVDGLALAFPRDGRRWYACCFGDAGNAHWRRLRELGGLEVPASEPL